MTDYQKGQEAMRAAILEKLREAHERAKGPGIALANERATITGIIKMVEGMEVEP